MCANKDRYSLVVKRGCGEGYSGNQAEKRVSGTDECGWHSGFVI